MGKWQPFPTTAEEIQQALGEIGINEQYEEYFVTDYDCNVDGIYDTLPEYANLDELNYLATQLTELDVFERQEFMAAAESGEYSGSVKDLINLTYNLESFDYIHDVADDKDLGYYWIEESGVYDTDSMGRLAQYIDYESFGRDIRLDEGGSFTDGGYVRNNGSSFTEHYNGLDVPEEYRVSSMPDKEARAPTMRELDSSGEFTSKPAHQSVPNKGKTPGLEL